MTTLPNSDAPLPAPRTRPHELFILLGGPLASVDQLARHRPLTGANLVEFHAQAGAVIFGPPAELATLHGTARAWGRNYRVIALTPENAAFHHHNVFAQIQIDEAAARLVSHYPARHLAVQQLRFRVLTEIPITLPPDAYIHRLPELRAALGLAGEGPEQVAIANFLARVEVYRRDVLTPSPEPLTDYYTFEKDVVSPDPEGSMRICLVEPLPPPDIPLDRPEEYFTEPPMPTDRPEPKEELAAAEEEAAETAEEGVDETLEFDFEP